MTWKAIVGVAWAAALGCSASHGLVNDDAARGLDAARPNPDAYVAPTDAYVAPTDAWIPPADAYATDTAVDAPACTLFPNAGCPAAHCCFPAGTLTSDTRCYEAGLRPEGSACDIGDECGCGLVCNGMLGPASCRRICRLGASGDCASGTCVDAGIPTYGVCG